MRVVLFIIGFLFFAQLGVSLGYHRYLSHRSFRLAKWFERFVILIGLPAGTPLQWAGNHRYHHAHADTPLDPHSPYFGGFWHAHCGWYIRSKNPVVCFLYSIAGPFRALFDAYHRPRSNLEYVYLASDWAEDPFMVWVSRPKVYFAIIWLYTFSVLGFAYAFLGPIGLLIAHLGYVYAYNLGDSVDSVLHLFGSEPFPGKSRARNLPILGVLGFGDGWHANHHAYPSLARHGHGPLQLDLTYLLLKVLRKIGIASDLKELSPAAEKKVLQAIRAES